MKGSVYTPTTAMLLGLFLNNKLSRSESITEQLCLCNMSHGVQLVELHGTCCRGKFCTIFMLRERKSASVHERMCRCDLSLKHVPATFSQVYQLCDLVPATCPCRQCVMNAILSPLHFAATCFCNMSPRVSPP